jgi:hypothetical protein
MDDCVKADTKTCGTDELRTPHGKRKWFANGLLSGCGGSEDEDNETDKKEACQENRTFHNNTSKSKTVIEVGYLR